jgi:thioredoxin-related protein
MNTKNPVMNRILLFFIVFSLAIYTESFAQAEKGVRFIKAENWQEILSIAKANKKNILVDVYTTWCGPCKMMDQNTYPDSALGALINKDFIAVKVQMDTTKNDNPYVKSWYGDAEKIKEAAKIEAFPTLLFYNQDGQWIFKSIGYKSAKALSRIATYAGSQEAAGNFKNDLLAYQNDHKDYKKLPDLIISVREIVGDQYLALDMSKDYKKNYLDHLPDSEYLNVEHIKFIANNGGEQLISIKDRLFNACYSQPRYVDSCLYKGSADQIINSVITKDVVLARLYKNEKAITTNPDWKKITLAVGKYKKINLDRFMLKAKLDFYYKIKNWEIYTILRSREIEKYPPVAFKQDPFDDLNTQAWYVFLGCNERKPLERALKWSELSIELEMKNLNPAYYDTRANILYKLGRTEEAIKFQKIAIEKNDELAKKTGKNWFPEYVVNLNKMLKGQPTWDTKQ